MDKEKEDFEISNNDYTGWDTRKEVTLTAAACVSLNIQPYRKDRSPRQEAEITTMVKSIKQAQEGGELPAGPTISIPELKKWLGDHGKYPAALFPEKRKKLPFKHGPDFRSIVLPDGREFQLTTQQALVVEILSEAYENGTPDIGGAYIFQRLGTNTSEDSLKKACFKHSKDICDALIESKKKGIYRLKAH